MEKKCSKCQEIKPLNDFYKNKYEKDGYCHICSQCDKLKSLNYLQNNYEKTKGQIVCGCGCSVRKDNIARHFKTKKHIDWQNPPIPNII